MRAISSAASIAIHTAVAAVALLGTTKAASPHPSRIGTPLVFPESPRLSGRSGGSEGISIPIPRIDWSPGPLTVPALPPGLDPRALTPDFSTDWAPRAAAGRAGGNAGEPGFSVAEMAPEVLSGPLPVYPDLLRQAGVEGQVILEARVDSSGRVQKGSVSVVFATHPGFVVPARHALMATLFRPARVNGQAVTMLVRVPFAFSLRGGTRRAR